MTVLKLWLMMTWFSSTFFCFSWFLFSIYFSCYRLVSTRLASLVDFCGKNLPKILFITRRELNRIWESLCSRTKIGPRKRTGKPAHFWWRAFLCRRCKVFRQVSPPFCRRVANWRWELASRTLHTVAPQYLSRWRQRFALNPQFSDELQAATQKQREKEYHTLAR